MASEPQTIPRKPPHRLRYHPPGTAPGTLTPLPGGSATVRVTVMDYGPEHVTEKEVAKVEDLFPFRDTASVTWINVEGLSDVALLESLGEHFKLHPLSLEDVLNCGQRPKVED